MVKVTVVQCTRRNEPRFEWALKSLNEQTYKDFEYLILDGLYDQRKDKVEDIIKKSEVNFPLLYLKDKPSRWRCIRPALCNARNTGLVFANGDYVVFHDDNCRLHPNWLERHVKWLSQGYIVAGNWLLYQEIDNNGNGIIGRFGWEHRSGIVKSPQIISGGWLYGGNFSFPLHVAEDINGFDELYDGEMGQDDIDFGIRAERKGYKIMYDPSCYLEYYYTNHGLLMDYGIYCQKEVELKITPVNIRLKDGKEHFSNEFLIQELLENKKRYTPRGNVIDIKVAREMMKTGKYSIFDMYKMMEDWIDPDPRDWRDGKLVKDKIKG